jgi:glycosyltransferase involved in cell wall biosynthesis
MTRPLSIAMIGQRGVPATFGGIERAVEEIGARLVERGHEVTVYCRSEYAAENGAAPQHRGMHLRHLPAPSIRGLEALVHSGVSTVHAVSARHDVLHFHALGPGVFSPLAKLAPHTAVVQTIHGLDDERAKWGRAAGTLLRFGKALSARVPDATIAVSEALARHYRDDYGCHAYAIPNGVTLAPAPQGSEALDRLGLEEGRFALFVGRLVPEKRIDLLIEAFRSVPGDVQLVIAGGSSHTDGYVEALERAAEGDPRIQFPGYVYGDELQQLYRDAGAFVLPSDLEGLPLVLLEAANQTCPIIASDIEPHLEVLGESGPGHRIFPKGEVEPLAAALHEAFFDRDEVVRGAKSRRDGILERYSWDEVAGRTEGLYQSLVSW